MYPLVDYKTKSAIKTSAVGNGNNNGGDGNGISNNYISGSDWCGWCMRLQKEVMKTPEFTKWATDNVILVELDFPRNTPQSPEIKKQNMELQQTFAIQGYPTVWFVNASKKDGKINLEKLGSTGYVAGGPSAWLAGANQILSKKKA